MRTLMAGSPTGVTWGLPVRFFAVVSLSMPLLLGGCEGWGPQGDAVLLHPGGDVLAAREVVDLTEDVSGDVMAIGRDVRFEGTVGGSYLAAAAEQEVSGRIDGSVRGAGGSVRVEASVGRNVTIVGGDVELAPGAVVEGNAYLGGGSVSLRGSVSGDVYVAAGDAVLDGEVGGDVRVEAGSLTLGPAARVDGELRYRVAEDGPVRISSEALVAEGVVDLGPREEDGGGDLFFTVARFLAFLLVGVALVALAPGTATHAADEVRMRGAAALGYGLVWLLLVPIAVFVLAVTLVGIPLALILAVVYGISLYVAPVVPGLWLGGEILRGRSSGEREDTVLLFLAGGAVVAIALLLPWVGLLARLLATCIGVGAVIAMIRDRDAGLGGV